MPLLPALLAAAARRAARPGRAGVVQQQLSRRRFRAVTASPAWGPGQVDGRAGSGALAASSTHHHHLQPRHLSTTARTPPAVAAAAAAAAAPAAAATSAHPAPTVVRIALAQTGEGIKECELTQWFVEPGATVAEFDPLCEVQSDKATVEVTARCGGVVAALHGAPGDVIQVGAPLLDLALPPGAAVPPGLAVVGGEEGSGGNGDDEEDDAAASGLSPPSTSTTTTATLASPAVRRVARELGVDLDAVAPGTGPGGRVLREDVEAAAVTGGGERVAAAAAAAAPLPSSSPPSTPSTPTTTTIPLRGFRRAMVKSMTAAASVPHFHYAEDARVDALVALRASLAADRATAAALATGSGSGSGGTPSPRLTYLPFILKALSLALASHPLVNASLAPGGDAITLHADHNFGVAVDTPAGLAVPVVSRVQDKSVLALAADIARLSSAAAAGALTPGDVSGGTLTVSNIGAVGGGGHAAPLVHVPQAAILAVGRIRPALVPGPGSSPTTTPALAHLLPLCWGADHRVLDGGTLARFSGEVARLLGEPWRLLVHQEEEGKR